MKFTKSWTFANTTASGLWKKFWMFDIPTLLHSAVWSSLGVAKGLQPVQCLKTFGVTFDDKLQWPSEHLIPAIASYAQLVWLLESFVTSLGRCLHNARGTSGYSCTIVKASQPWIRRSGCNVTVLTLTRTPSRHTTSLHLLPSWR